GEKQCTLELSFLEHKETVSAVIDSYKEGNLVVLVRIEDHQAFLEFSENYPGYQEWARDHIFGLFHSEYFLIQQMNNQLVDAQRKLTRSNRRLEYALKENQEINEQLEQARIVAEHANRSKTRFLDNMSHDIRTPMNAIVGLTELMQHHLHEPEVLQNYIVKLQSSGHYLLDLINDVLDLSKIESGSLELQIEPMDLEKQIDQILTIIRPRIEKKKQNLIVDREYQKSCRLMGDPIRFRQILMNLFSNAVKYTPEGGRITFRIQETVRKGKVQKYRFQIEDSGIGMTREFMEHIFDPFARAEADVKEIQGTGLGMAITKNIVDAMKGTIHVESTIGKGSRFDVEIPFELCQEKDTSEGKEEAVSLRGMRFLCAEDDELNAEILGAMLELEGADCTIYENGKLLTEAFEKIRPGEYEAIIMDVQMPVMNGYEATRQIRNSKNPLGRNIPIIAMTANAFSDDIQRCLDSGMDAHLSKPLNMSELAETIGALCKHEVTDAGSVG
ncbi:MAG: ATP-binding protein, partial [bacterium]|nr:ATP-binding protein [bacterium]